MSDAINPDHYKRLPAEAIEIIESAIEGAPTSQEAYLQGQALKYLLRANHKNGREDIHKAKWYLDRMVASFTVPSDLLDGLVKAWKPEGGKCKQVHPEQSQPPGGWRFLEVGEVIRKGDRCFTKHSGSIDCLTSVGEKFNHEAHYPTIRRNRFNVGEIVVHVNGIEPCEVVGFDREKDKYWITSNGNQYAYESKWLAPYIEDAK